MEDHDSIMGWCFAPFPYQDLEEKLLPVTPRLEELELFRLQQESKSVAPSVVQKEDPPTKKASQKRKTATRLDELPITKRQKGTTHNTTGIFEKDTVRNSAEENNVGQTNSKVNNPGASNEEQIKHSTSKETYRDQCTAFISNLGHQAKEEHLRDFFRDIGGVTAIRLLKDKFTRKSRMSIARSDPKQSKKREFSGRSSQEHSKTGPASDIDSAFEGSDSRKSVGEQSVSVHAHGDNVQLKGKNTFAVPRTVVRPLGWGKSELKNEETADKPKSNDEFRNMLLKS